MKLYPVDFKQWPEEYTILNKALNKLNWYHDAKQANKLFDSTTSIKGLYIAINYNDEWDNYYLVVLTDKEPQIR